MDTVKSGRIFNRYFVLLFITSVCFCCATEMLNVVLPLYVTEDLGKTAAVSGLMTTFYLAFDAAIGLGAAVWGALIDAAGYVTTYRLTACGYGLMMVLAVIAFARWKREV